MKKRKKSSEPVILKHELNRPTYVDKSKPKGVFLANFIVSCFFSIFTLFSAPLIKYSNKEKNELKWTGVVCGIVFPFTLGLILIYVIKKYNQLKKKENPQIVIGIRSSSFQLYLLQGFEADFQACNIPCLCDEHN